MEEERRKQDVHVETERRNGVISWRLAALEEAMRYHSAQIEKLAERQQETRGDLAAIRHDYVGREELRKETREKNEDERDVWTLRLVAIGTFANTALGVLALIIQHKL